MRKLIVIALVLAGAFLLVPAAHAQFTQVTGTVVDPNGIPYGAGTMSAVLTPGSPGGWTLSGQPYSGRVGPITLDSNGTFVANFGSNALILPAGTYWQITVNSNQGGIAPPLGTGSQTFTITITISGASQNISVALDAAAPKLTNFAGGGGVSITATLPVVATPNPITGTGDISCPTCSTGGTPAAPNGSLQFDNNGALGGYAPTLDCSAYPGADFAAQWGNCLTAASAVYGTVASIANFSNPQTLNSPITVPSGVVTYCGGLQINMNAAITLVGSGLVGLPTSTCNLTNVAGGFDMVTAGNGPNIVKYIVFAGARHVPATGDCLVLSNTGNNSDVEFNQFLSCVNDITNNGAPNDLIANNVIEDYGDNGIFCSTCDDEIAHNQFSDSGDATGSAIALETSPIVNVDAYNTFTLSSASPGISCDTSSFLTITTSNINDSGTYPAIDCPGDLTVNDNVSIVGGGANGPAIRHDSGNKLLVEHNQGIAAGAGGDGIQTQSNQDAAIDHNGTITTETAGGSGICGVRITGNAIGALIDHNSFDEIDGSTATGHNFGVCLIASSGNHLNGISVDHNTFTGQNNANDFGVYLDNAADVAPNFASSNTIAFNSFVDMNTAISRLDTEINTNYYTQNAQVATPTLFDAGGSTRDVITQTIQPAFTFATLPIGGSGSIIEVSDCTPFGTIAGAGNGCTASNVGGTWMGNQAIVGADTHTAEITGNYGPVTLLASTFPTGSYFITIYAEVTTNVAGSTITTSIAYDDDTGAQTQSGALFSAATAGTIQPLTFPIRFVTGTALTYSTTTASNPKYKIIARVEAQ